MLIDEGYWLAWHRCESQRHFAFAEQQRLARLLGGRRRPFRVVLAAMLRGMAARLGGATSLPVGQGSTVLE